MARLYFEDFLPGKVATYGRHVVERDMMIAFARTYDAQPMHVDEEAARNSFVGGLIASGWNTCGILMRLNCEGFLLDSTSMGGPGIDDVRWLKPVRAGDVLSARRTVLEARPSRSKPNMGLVRFRFELINQADEIVMTQLNSIMFARREPGMPSPSRPLQRQKPAGAATSSGLADSASPALPPAPFLEDLVPGAAIDLGSHTFTADDIVAFAQAFDPQPFHLSEEAGKASHFGGLVASGWQTAAVWMKLMVAHWTRDTQAVLSAGGRPARLGPSPGFTDLKWLKPVRPGDALTYRCTLIDARPSASRPGWGIARHHNTAHNAKGEQVFAFNGAVLWEMRNRA